MWVGQLLDTSERTATAGASVHSVSCVNLAVFQNTAASGSQQAWEQSNGSCSNQAMTINEIHFSDSRSLAERKRTHKNTLEGSLPCSSRRTP